MTESDPKLPGKERGFLTFFLKFLFFVIALVAVMLTVLFNMGGSTETLHKSMEKFISDSTGGRPTKIEKVNRISFFPIVGADFDKLEVKETPASKERVIYADKIRLFVTFWGFISRSMTLKSLLVENLFIKEGVLGRKSFAVEKMFIDHDKGTRDAFIKANGMLGGRPWSLKLGMEVAGSIGGYTYQFGDNRPLALEIEDVSFEADLEKQVNDYISIKNIIMGSPEPMVSGDLSLSLLEGLQVKVAGRLVSGEKNDIYKPDLIINYSKKPIKISGKVSSVEWHASDFEKDKTLVSLINKGLEIFQENLKDEEKAEAKPYSETEKNQGNKEKFPESAEKNSTTSLCMYDFEVLYTIDKLYDKDDKVTENIEFMAVNKDGTLEIAPKKGEIQPYAGACENLPILRAVPAK